MAATLVIVARGSTQDVATGALLVSEGILASTAYEARARPVVERASAWTSWLPATTPATLITSPDLAEGSVTLQIQTVALGPFTMADLPPFTVVAILDIGAIGVGQGWERRLHFEARANGPAVPNDFLLEIQRRRAFLGGPFEAWDTIDTIRVEPAVWQVYADSGTIAGTYDDFEYRLRVTQLPSGLAAGVEILRNVYFTAVRITK